MQKTLDLWESKPLPTGIKKSGESISEIGKVKVKYAVPHIFYITLNNTFANNYKNYNLYRN